MLDNKDLIFRLEEKEEREPRHSVLSEDPLFVKNGYALYIILTNKLLLFSTECLRSPLFLLIQKSLYDPKEYLSTGHLVSH